MRYTAPSTHELDEYAPPGSLHLICGCMFAGKTEQLIDEILAQPPARVKVFKHVIDDRYDPRNVVSHRQRTYPATPIERAAQTYDYVDELTNLVAIDEGHFFDDQLPVVCRRLASSGLKVVVTALDRDSWGQPFPLIHTLGTLADLVTVKRALCAKCRRPATRTQRVTPIVGGNMVSGPGDSEPRCIQCWFPPPTSGDQITRLASNTGPCVQHSS